MRTKFAKKYGLEGWGWGGGHYKKTCAGGGLEIFQKGGLGKEGLEKK